MTVVPATSEHLTEKPFVMSAQQATWLLFKGKQLFVDDFAHLVPFGDGETLVRRTMETDLLAYASGYQKPDSKKGLAGVIRVQWPSKLAFIQRLSPLKGLQGQENVVLSYLYVDQGLQLVLAICCLEGTFPKVKISSIDFTALSAQRLEGLFGEEKTFSQFLPTAFQDLAQTLLARVNDRDLVHRAWQNFCVYAREEVGITIHV